MSLTDELVKKCLNKEPAAQKELYKQLNGKLFAICLRYTKNRAEAEDWLQESFIKIFSNLKAFKFEGSFEGWTRRITVNHILSDLRKKTKLKFTDELEENTLTVEEDAHSNFSKEDLIRFINLLPEGKKVVFNLYVIEGYSHKEIGEMLNINEGTSRGQLAKAREQLIEIHKKYNKINAEQIS
ncbi:MAG TPA: sigma-70 family RNA polymerase sigma factor [Cytophagaceae bacterium]|jgi:RNA polymerase sigma factor (sigma-70 family)|nr:sigma-70 family RNA polymerase sigma factor [Cytophagaceae bacterium]